MPRDDRIIDQQQSVQKESLGSSLDETAAHNGDLRSQERPPFAPPAAPTEVGRLGKYRILRELGRGGMGAVYLAHDERLRRKVALKVMLPKFAADIEAKNRFLREARAAAQISSDYVVNIYEAEEIDGIPFIALQYLQGMALDQYLKANGPLAPAQILRIGREAALGLAAAHQIGLVHRDIKPGNLWLEAPGGRVKILDFGLAKSIEGDASVDLTGSGVLVGTPVYMAPEQARGEKVDGRTDLYSLGGVLYRLCTGNLPVKGNTPMAVLASLVADTPTPIRELNPSIPEPLAAITHQLLAKKADQRPATAKDLAARLMQITKELTTPAILAATPVSVQPLPFAELATAESDPMARTRNTAATLTLGPVPARPSTSVSPRRPPLSWLIGGGLALLALILVAGGIVITIRNKDGTVTKIEAPPGAKVEVDQNGKKTEFGPDPKKDATPPTFKNRLGMEFVKVPKGTAWLGGGAGRQGETKVVIEQDFYLGKYEVTQEEWEKMTGLAPSFFSRDRDGKSAVKDTADADLKRFPVEWVSWEDCQIFIELLNKKEKESGWVYRLPKEAEWEYACRGGPVDKQDSAFDFYFAKPTNTLLPEQANFECPKALKRTSKVGSYEPNRLGLHDMHGNVFEWCEDSEKGADGASLRVFRGGGWSDASGDCRSAFRLSYASSSRRGALGLRLARVRVGTRSQPTADRDRKAAEYVLSIGGTVRVNDEERDLREVADLPREPFRLTYVYAIRNRRLDNAGMAHFKGCSHLKTLDLWDTNVGDEGFANFAGCTSLTRLLVGHTKVTDAGVANFKDCRNLTVLHLPETSVGDAGVAFFAGCSSLTELNLFETKVTGAGLAPFKNCAQLTFLDLSNTKVSDSGLAYFKDCYHLVYLRLNETKVGDTGLAYLKDCKSLKDLGLGNTKVSDSGLAYLKDCKSLVDLNLFHTNVGDEGLSCFKDCRNLKVLNLSGTQVSDKSLAHFQGVRELTFLNLSATKATNMGLASFKDCKNLSVLWLNGIRATDEGIANFKDCRNLTSLALASTDITDDGLVVFKSCKNLTALLLDHTRVTDEGLANFKDCKNLVDLNLFNVNLSDEGLSCFKDCRNLKVLNLSGTQVSDKSLAHFQEVRELTFLNLSATKATDTGLANFKDCKNLSVLWLNGIRATDAGLAHFKDCRNLTSLALVGTGVTDEGLVLFKDCKNLAQLHLSGTQVTDAGLSRFKDCGTLTHLYLHKMKITAAMIETLRQALPKCRIESDYGTFGPK